MNWYYSSQGQQAGPVDEDAFQALVSAGQIQPATLVWNSEMTGWKPLSEVRPSAAAAASPTLFCSECGARCLADEMIQFGSARVCANCKDRFAQKLREGVSLGVTRRYAGFWIRVLAKLIDGVIFGIVYWVVILAFFRPADLLTRNNFGFLAIVYPLQFLFAASYEIFLTSRYGGTLGKLALGLRVITAGGDRLPLGLSTGRYFAHLVNSFTLGIGYMMVGWDSEKRGLHDRICNTRVVRT